MMQFRRQIKSSRQNWACRTCAEYVNRTRCTILTNLPKTNNCAEAWHRSFEATVDEIHDVNIYRFIEALKVEQTLMEANYEQAVAGEEGPSQQRTYKDAAQRLLNAVGKYNENINLTEYLQGVAHNITY